MKITGYALALLLLASPAYAGPIESKAAQIQSILGDDVEDDALSAQDQSRVLDALAGLTPLQRFRVTLILDRSQASDLRTLYDRLSGSNQARLLGLVQESGLAAKNAGLQEIGVISDCDDTAFPTQYQPDGPVAFKGAADLYKALETGSDGKGTPGDVHYVSARPSFLIGETKVRLERAGLPVGTFDTRKNLWGIAFGGLDDIEKSKIANADLWIALHPGQRFVLLGDTIQRDPETYRALLVRHPEAVAAVFIHEAGGSHRDPAQFPGENFFNSYSDVEQILASKGIVAPGARDPGGSLVVSQPAGTHDVKTTSGFFSQVKGFFSDAGYVAKKGFTSLLDKLR